MKKKKMIKPPVRLIKKELMLQLLLIFIIFNLVYLLNFVDVIRRSILFLVIVIVANWIAYYVAFRLFNKEEIQSIIGSKKWWRNLLIALAFFIVIVVIFVSGILRHLQSIIPAHDFGFDYAKTITLGASIILFLKILTAGITEEFIFRGFILTRIRNLMYYCCGKAKTIKMYALHTIAAMVISSLLYAFSYWWTGLLGAVTMLIMGVILAISYYVSKSINVPIIIHLLYSFFVMSGAYTYLVAYLTSIGAYPFF
jgi:membrane protease YdiL (CAAX protease family)